MCQHRFCNQYINHNISGVGSILLLKTYNGTNGLRVPNAMLFAKERYGRFSELFNVIGGKLENKHNGCLLGAMIAELNEEVKMDRMLSYKDGWNMFDALFKDNGHIRHYLTQDHNGSYTVIFVGVLPAGTSRNGFNNLINEDNRNNSRPQCYKEMYCVDWFNPQTYSQIENKGNCVLSGYATKVIREFKQHFPNGL